MGNNLIKIETEGLSQVGVKLIEVFANGISGLYKPLQEYLMAIVQNKKLLLENKTQNQIVKNNLEFFEKDLEGYTPRDVRAVNNLLSILGQSLTNLAPKTSVQQISDEWMAMFVDYAKEISDEDIKIIWSNLLAREATMPGSYFKRTLFVLKNMEKIEAEWFLELSAYVIDGKIPTIIVQNYDFNKIQSLTDCGLLNSEECSADMISFPEVLKAKTYGLNIHGHCTMSFNCYTLTDAGLQLWDIINVQTNEKMLQDLKNDLEKRYKGCEISIVTL